MLTYPFKRHPHQIVKHTQTTCRQKPKTCLSVFDHFVGLALKELVFRLYFNISWYANLDMWQNFKNILAIDLSITFIKIATINASPSRLDRG